MSLSQTGFADAALASSFDITSLPAGFAEDPFPTYRALLEHAPVKRFADGSVMLTHHADLDRIYRDTTAFSSDKKTEFLPKFGPTPLYEHHTTSLVFNDPPLHTRVRKIIMGALTPRAISAMEPGLVALVDRLLDRMEEKGEVDLVEDFAAAIPIEVIGNLFVMPHEERGPLRAQDRQRPVAQRPALLMRHHEQVADHLDRYGGREILDQVDIALLGHAVEQAVDKGYQPGLHRRDRARRQRAHHDLAHARMQRRIVEDEAGGVVLVEGCLAELRQELDLLVGRERPGVAVDAVEIGIARQHHRAVGKTLDRCALQQRAIGGEGVVRKAGRQGVDVETLRQRGVCRCCVHLHRILLRDAIPSIIDRPVGLCKSPPQSAKGGSHGAFG